MSHDDSTGTGRRSPHPADDARLIKVQSHDDVRLFCQLVDRLQEVHVPDV